MNEILRQIPVVTRHLVGNIIDVGVAQSTGKIMKMIVVINQLNAQILVL